MAGFTINYNNCIGGVRNTGNPLCAIDPNFLIGSIMAPRGTILDGTTQTITQQLTALIYNASRSARGYPFYDFEKMTPSSDKLQVQSMPTGARHPVREGWNDWMFQYFDGALSKHQAARTFNGSNWDFFFIDTNPLNGQNNIYGTQVINTSTGLPYANKIAAFPVLPGGFFWAHPWEPNTGTERTAYQLQYAFKQTYSNDLIAAVACSFDFATTFPGINDVNVLASATVNGTPKNFNVSLVSPTGTDIGALYSAALSGAGSTNWNGAVSSSGLPLTVTSSTWVPSTVSNVPGYFTLVFGATNYPTPPAPIMINLTNANTLQGVGVPYESAGALNIAST